MIESAVNNGTAKFIQNAYMVKGYKDNDGDGMITEKDVEKSKIEQYYKDSAEILRSIQSSVIRPFLGDLGKGLDISPVVNARTYDKEIKGTVDSPNDRVEHDRIDIEIIDTSAGRVLSYSEGWYAQIINTGSPHDDFCVNGRGYSINLETGELQGSGTDVALFPSEKKYNIWIGVMLDKIEKAIAYPSNPNKASLQAIAKYLKAVQDRVSSGTK